MRQFKHFVIQFCLLIFGFFFIGDYMQSAASENGEYIESERWEYMDSSNNLYSFDGIDLTYQTAPTIDSNSGAVTGADYKSLVVEEELYSMVVKQRDLFIKNYQPESAPKGRHKGTSLIKMNRSHYFIPASEEQESFEALLHKSIE